MTSLENRIPTTEPCFQKSCPDPVFQWWPWTTEGLRHEGQSMNACTKHFHEVWIGED